MKENLARLSVLICAMMLVGCEPEVGSKAWCKKMEKKSKGDWTANEAKEYAKNCIFKSDD